MWLFELWTKWECLLSNFFNCLFLGITRYNRGEGNEIGQMNQHVPSCFNRQAGRLDDSTASPNDFLWTALVFSVHLEFSTESKSAVHTLKIIIIKKKLTLSVISCFKCFPDPKHLAQVILRWMWERVSMFSVTNITWTLLAIVPSSTVCVREFLIMSVFYFNFACVCIWGCTACTLKIHLYMGYYICVRIKCVLQIVLLCMYRYIFPLFPSMKLSVNSLATNQLISILENRRE